MFPKRPGRGETEEDLLKYQEEFLQSNASPAVSVVKKPGDKRSNVEIPMDASTKESKRDVVDIGGLPASFGHTTTAPPVKKSKFKERKKGNLDIEEDDPEERLDCHDPHIANVLSKIIEKDISNIPVYFPNIPVAKGFPTALHRDKESGTSSSEGGKKKSLFARQFEKKKAKAYGIPVVDAKMVAQRVQINRDPREQTSHMVTGIALSTEDPAAEALKIHRENQARLEEMSTEEILKEQKQVMEILDPSLIEFLKNKKKAHPQSKQQENKTVTDVHMAETMEQQNEEDRKEKDIAMEELPIKPKKDWVHMDKVEQDKLSWTKDLPPPPTAGHTEGGQQARFDFNGKLLQADTDLPPHLGLHHHGDEPERAGYTLEELFQLARSTNIQQRVMAFNTISNILKNARHGMYENLLQTKMIPSLLEGGLIFLIRLALDDTIDNTMAAAVECLRNLIVCDEDEEAADRVFGWYRGKELPSLSPQVVEDAEEDEEEEKKEDTDGELLKKDVIKGLLKMTILPRLRYILEVWKPAANVVLNIFDILIRIARHSREAVYQIMQCQRLTETISSQFLPTVWDPLEKGQMMSTLYGYPLAKAMTLVRVLSTASKSMASQWVSKELIMNSIARYLAQDAGDLGLYPSEANSLQLESWRTWNVFVMYGLTKEQFSELYPLLSQKLCEISNTSCKSPKRGQSHCVAALGLLESYIHVSTSPMLEASKAEAVTEKRFENSPLNPLPWSKTAGLLSPVMTCLQSCLQHFADTFFEEKFDLGLTASCLNFLASYYHRIEQQSGYNAVEVLTSIEKMCKELLLPTLETQAFQRTLKDVRDHSVILWGQSSLKRKEIPSNLPEFGSLLGDSAKPCPVVRQENSLHFVTAVCHLVLTFGKLHKDVIAKIFSPILENKEVLLYLRKICQAKHTHAGSNTFAKFENLLQYYLVMMAKLKTDCDMSLYHQVALFLFTRIHQGDEHIGHELLSSVLFNKDFIGNLQADQSCQGLQDLEITDKIVLSSATGHSHQVDSKALVDDLIKGLPSIRATYLQIFAGFAKDTRQAKSRALHLPLYTETLMSGDCGQILAPIDWVFLPIISLYNQSINESSTQTNAEESVPPAVISMVTNVLRWFYFLENWRPHLLETLSFSVKISRLFCIFLSGSDLFLDGGIHAYLAALLKLYCKPVYLDRMDFTKLIPGLLSFYNLFMLVLSQYEAVSFGDSLFGSYVLLPLQQKHSVTLRKAVWSEHQVVLRSLSIPLKEVLIPIDRFLEPEETDLELIRLYFQALFAKLVQPKWSPLLYLCAIHHVNRFFYTQDKKHKKLRLAMFKQLQLTPNQVLRQHVMFYKKFNIDSELGFEMYQELPKIRQNMVDEWTT